MIVVCGFACVACPCAIAWVSLTYAESGFDTDFDPWAVYAVDGLFWSAAAATVGLIRSLRSWWWVGAVVAIPLLVLTAILAVTGGMWIEGTYF
jgi:hypothetical protein